MKMKQTFPCKKKWVSTTGRNDLNLVVRFDTFTDGEVVSVNESSVRYSSYSHHVGRYGNWQDIRYKSQGHGYWEDYDEYLEYDPTQQADQEDDI